MSRKITITVKTQDIDEVMNSLKCTDESSESSLITLDIDLKDTKENYKYLTTSDKIVDWFFTEDNKLKEKENLQSTTEVKKEILEKGPTVTNHKQVKNSTFHSDCKCDRLGGACLIDNDHNTEFEKEIDKPNTIDIVIEKFLGLQRYPVNNFERLCRFIDAVWNVKTTSPGFLFSEKVFEQRILSEYISIMNREYPEILVSLIANYYSGSIYFSEILKDVLNRLKLHWNILNNCSSLGEVLMNLFNDKGYAIRFFG